MKLLNRRLSAIILVVALLIGSVAAGFVLTSGEAYAASGKRNAAMSLLSKNGAFFDFRKEAGQKLYGYDTLQGACAAEGFGYLTLYDRNVEKCRIVKVALDSLAVTKVSAPLPVYHANNLTFNTRKHLVVATCCRVKDKRAVLVDPNTLKVVGKKDIKLTRKVKHLPKKERKKYKGFTAIAYNEKHDCYIGRLRGSGNAILFDGDLKPVRYFKLKGKRNSMMNQGMDSVGDRVYDVRSFKGKHKYSVVTIHTLNGKYVGQIRFPFGKAPGNELQCLFHDGGQFYAGFYLTTSQKHDTKAHHVKRNNKLYRVHNVTG